MESKKAMAPEMEVGMNADGMVLKLVFAIDTTGSQQSNIDAIKTNVKGIYANLLQNVRRVEVALAYYKDFPQNGKEDPYVVFTVPFSSNAEEVVKAMEGITASGGGDTPEAVATAMDSVLKLDWGDGVEEDGATESEAQCTRVVIWFSDAPPHGLGEFGDKYPNGDPNGNDATKLINAFASRKIRVNVAGCGVMTSTSNVGNAFFRLFASRTCGTFVNMSHSAQLADVIVASTIESVQLNRAASEARVQLEALGINPAQNLEELDDEEAEIVQNVFRSVSASDPVLERCDAAICAVDCNEATAAAAACVADVVNVQTDKEFKAAFASWIESQRCASPAYRLLGCDDGSDDDGGLADVSYKSMSADCSVGKRNRVGAPRRERTAERLYHIVTSDKTPKGTCSAP